jgi:hypothetical protein
VTPRALLAALASLTAAAVAAPAVAAPPPARTVEAAYTVSGVGGVLRGTVGAQGQSAGAVVVPLTAADRYARIQLTDDSGLPAGGDVALDLNHDNLADVFLESFCGRTEAAQRIPAYEDAVLIVYPVVAACGPGATSPTTGVARITLTPR